MAFRHWYDDGTVEENVTDETILAREFEAHRGHLRAVAYRMLGSATEAEDAVQEAWLRLSRAGGDGIENLGGWLTTVVARVALDSLRARQSRRESGTEPETERPAASSARATVNQPLDPEQEAVLAESVGLALLVVLDRLTPGERLAFVLHDLFAVPFEEIAPMLGRTPVATRKLASRARVRVQGAAAGSAAELRERRVLVERFLAALRAGDVEALLTVLDPEFSVRADAVAAARGTAGAESIRGARAWAEQAVRAERGAALARLALVEGEPGLVVAPRGKLFRALRFTFAGGRIAGMEVIGEPARLANLAIGAGLDHR